MRHAFALADRAEREFGEVPVGAVLVSAAVVPLVQAGMPPAGGAYWAGALAVGLWVLMKFTVLGFNIRAVGANLRAAAFSGVPVTRTVVLVAMLSGALAGLAGATKAIVFQLASLTDVHWSMSGEVVLMALVGGLGTLSGPLIGSAVVVLLENKTGEFGNMLAALTSVEWFKTLGESVTMVTGLIFVICVLAFRRGIMGELIAWLERRRGAVGANRAP